MRPDTTVMTDFKTGRIDKTNSRIPPEASLQIATERHHARGHPRHESAVAHRGWKGISPILMDVMLVVAFEVAVMTLVKCNQNRHNFTQAQGTPTVTSFQVVAQ